MLLIVNASHGATQQKMRTILSSYAMCGSIFIKTLGETVRELVLDRVLNIILQKLKAFTEKALLVHDFRLFMTMFFTVCECYLLKC